MSGEAPPVDVLRAFGVEGPPRALRGGQGTSWAAGHVVLKPEDGPCHAWLGSVLTDVDPTDVRIGKPVRTLDGSWRHHGWVATERMEGVERSPRCRTGWLDIIAAGRAFHRAVSHLPRPDCLDERRDPWATADRAAWDEQPPQLHTAFAAVAVRLHAALGPLGSPQLVHGDLAGNVLFAAGLPPAVIDLSLYWRPPEFAEGVVVADALCWHGAAPSLPSELGVSVPAVARGLLFRMLTTSARARRGQTPYLDLAGEARRYEEVASALGL